MKKILIVSATKNSNFSLSKELETITTKLGANVKTISLESFSLPIYKNNLDSKIKNQNKEIVNKLSNHFIETDGIIICAPEYNGSIPPIVVNAIAWISVTTENWRDGFNNKIALICTSSGGPGTKFLSSMRLQLEHLGSIVLSRTISVNKSNPLDKDSAKKILNQFIKLL
tara:strand:- start:2628 stop:3137 length:510 start_codon:yes stop_codon:yes gene_type:complete